MKNGYKHLNEDIIHAIITETLLCTKKTNLGSDIPVKYHKNIYKRPDILAN